MTENTYLNWVCKCGTNYAIELKVPKKLRRCKKNISKEPPYKPCNTSFPDQKTRDILEKIQLHPFCFCEE